VESLRKSGLIKLVDMCVPGQAIVQVHAQADILAAAAILGIGQTMNRVDI
jgi:hypothetical protein